MSESENAKTIAPFTTISYVRTCLYYNVFEKMQSIWKADPEKKNDEGSDNVPEGFKKFLKKTR